jgi:hypothetical protein
VLTPLQDDQAAPGACQIRLLSLLERDGHLTDSFFSGYP